MTRNAMLVDQQVGRRQATQTNVPRVKHRIST